VLDLRLLHQAVTLARYQNYARAAQALHVTQPALSRSIAGLEARLGEKLFNRTSRGVEVTAFGDMLLARGRALLDDAAEVERDFKLLRGLEIGELRVGVGVYPAQMSVGAAVGRLAASHPSLRIDVITEDVRVTVDALLGGGLDLAVIELSIVAGETRLATEALPPHKGYFYCRAGHPLLALEDVAIEHILQYPLVGPRIVPRAARHFLALAKNGTIDGDTGDYIPPIKVDSIQMARDVVLASNAVAMAPIACLSEEIAAGKLGLLGARPAWMQTAYGLVWLRDIALSPAAEAFRQAVWSVEREISAMEAAANGADRALAVASNQAPASRATTG
jgi:DNA-binding transcriptional LysR family regulator